MQFVFWVPPTSAGGDIPQDDATPAIPALLRTRTPKDADKRFLARDILRALGKAHQFPTDDKDLHLPTHKDSSLHGRLLQVTQVSLRSSRYSSSPVGDQAGFHDFYVLVPPPPPYVVAAWRRGFGRKPSALASGPLNSDESGERQFGPLVRSAFIFRISANVFDQDTLMGGSTAHSRNSDATSRQKCVAAARYMFCFGAYITTLQQFNYLNPMMSTLWMMACSVIKLLAVRWLDHEELNSCLEDAIGASKIFAHGDMLMSHQLTNLKKLKTQCFSTDMRRPDEHPKSEQSFKYCFRHFWHSDLMDEGRETAFWRNTYAPFRREHKGPKKAKEAIGLAARHSPRSLRNTQGVHQLGPPTVTW
ncbi:hypothetical protein B0H13DRAFT_2290516 [Mycena leptocephala]|nr:hypothetical protein B0H13DRAFT_2290516 [Mycena leptocephala]